MGTFFTIVIIVIIVIIIAIYISMSNDKIKQEESKKKREEYEEKRMQRQASERISFETKLAEYNELYGGCTKTIRCGASSFSENNIRQHILIFENASIIIIKEVEYPFNSILGYSITDNKREIITNSICTTTTDTGSMVGRAIVGGVLLGGVGAVIGGTTAKKETTTQSSPIKIEHEYCININLNNLSNPTLTINLGKDHKCTQEIANILNVIIERNKK